MKVYDFFKPSNIEASAVFQSQEVYTLGPLTNALSDFTIFIYATATLCVNDNFFGMLK